MFVTYGATECDSVRVFFPLNKSYFNPVLDNDRASMNNFIDGIVRAAHSGNLDYIVVYGFASPDGPFLNNEKLSEQRCNAIADYISRHADIPMDKIRTNPGGVAWDGLRVLVVENTDTPSRGDVLSILNESIPAACTDRVKCAQCIKKLIAIDNGNTYNWMLETYFPKLRYALAIYYTYNASDSSYDNPISEYQENTVRQISSEVSEETANDSVCCDTVPLRTDLINHVSLPPFHRLAIKTNLIYDALLLPNLEVEWLINPHWSVAFEGGVAWWGKYSDNKSYRLAMFSPEARRWIRPRSPWHGFYVGLFAGGGFYDFENGGNGYRGEGVMGGISGGFMFPVSRCLSFEAAIGVGYLYSRYKEYKPLDGCHVYQRTKDLNYFGPLKVKFSLVWRLCDWNKRKYNKGSYNTSEAGTMVEYEK